MAEIVHSYPDYLIYFMGRDAEFLYDTALAALKPNEDGLRFHLILTSSSILRDPHLKNYLMQEGITDEALIKGKKFLFVDTGYTGSASAKLIALYPKVFSSQFKTHLLCSNNARHPSTRVFLTTFDPRFEDLEPASLKWKLVGKLENFPMYFHSGDHCEVNAQGRWTPMCPKKSQGLLGSEVNKDKAVARIKEIKEFMKEPAQIKRYEEKALLWRTLSQLWKNKQDDDVLHEFRKILSQYRTLGRSIVRDFLESRRLNDLSDRHDFKKLDSFLKKENLSYPRNPVK